MAQQTPGQPVSTNPRYSHAALITPADGADLPTPGFCEAIYVGGAGNINLTTMSGETVLFTGVLVGTILPVRANRVLSTNTTATLLIQLW